MSAPIQHHVVISFSSSKEITAAEFKQLLFLYLDVGKGKFIVRGSLKVESCSSTPLEIVELKKG